MRALGCHTDACGSQMDNRSAYENRMSDAAFIPQCNMCKSCSQSSLYVIAQAVALQDLSPRLLQQSYHTFTQGDPSWPYSTTGLSHHRCSC